MDVAAGLRIEGLSKRYGSSQAVQPTSLDVAEGEFVTLLGPSGCGKSSLLRMIAGITPASGGRIVLRGQPIEGLPPERRDIAMVFQTYALFPHMTVAKNIEFGLRMKKIAAPERQQRIAHAVSICNLDGLLGRLPRQLSGGQQQRVALARAIVMRPALLLFDEPLSNLDAKLRESLRDELVKLHRSVGAMSLYVTHDQAEAMTMSDRVLVMDGGRVVESGTPMQIYRHPQHAFTARFLGHTNLLQLPVAHDVASLPWGPRVAIDGVSAGTHQAQVSLRPEDIGLEPDPCGHAVIASVHFAGATVHYAVRAGGHDLRVACAGSAALLPVGQRVLLRLPRLMAMKPAPATEAGAA